MPFRLAVATLAIALFCSAAWLLTIDFANTGKLPLEQATVLANQARTAALVGLFRGDLWAQYALSLSSALSRRGTDNTDPVPTIEEARTAGERAVRLSPANPVVWLLLAQIDLRLGPLDRAPSLLKMSYYTGPNASDLFAVRLHIATESDMIVDPELQILVEGEIRTTITYRPELRSAIGDAYRAASPSGRHFFEKTLIDLDPALLKTIQSGR